MKLLKAIAPITLLVVAGLTAPVVAGEIRGRQYLPLRIGLTPIADNAVYYVPCTPIKCNRIEIQILKELIQLSDMLKDLQPIGGAFENTNRILRKYTGESTGLSIAKELSQYKGFSATRSDFKGEYSFNCPTSSCLVYSSVSTGYVQGFWVDTVSSRSEHDLTSSNAKKIYNID